MRCCHLQSHLLLKRLLRECHAKPAATVTSMTQHASTTRPKRSGTCCPAVAPSSPSPPAPWLLPGGCHAASQPPSSTSSAALHCSQGGATCGAPKKGSACALSPSAPPLQPSRLCARLQWHPKEPATLLPLLRLVVINRYFHLWINSKPHVHAWHGVRLLYTCTLCPCSAGAAPFEPTRGAAILKLQQLLPTSSQKQRSP